MVIATQREMAIRPGGMSIGATTVVGTKPLPTVLDPSGPED